MCDFFVFCFEFCTSYSALVICMMFYILTAFVAILYPPYLHIPFVIHLHVLLVVNFPSHILPLLSAPLPLCFTPVCCHIFHIYFTVFIISSLYLASHKRAQCFRCDFVCLTHLSHLFLSRLLVSWLMRMTYLHSIEVLRFVQSVALNF